MRYLKLFGAALGLACALGAVVLASASALPTLLPVTITEYTGKSTGGSTVLEKANGNKVTCTSATGEGTVEANGHLGNFHIHFSKCTAESGLATCTGLGENSGIILSLGSWHYVYDTLGATLGAAGVAILYLVGETHFVCSALGIEKLIIVPLGGMVLCLVTKPTTLSKSHEFACKKGATAGTPEETKYYNEGGTLVSIHRLEAIESEGTAEESNQQGSGTVETSVAGEIMI